MKNINQNPYGDKYFHRKYQKQIVMKTLLINHLWQNKWALLTVILIVIAGISLVNRILTLEM